MKTAYHPQLVNVFISYPDIIHSMWVFLIHTVEWEVFIIHNGDVLILHIINNGPPAVASLK